MKTKTLSLEIFNDVDEKLPTFNKEYITKNKQGKIRVAFFEPARNIRVLNNDWFFYIRNINPGKRENCFIPISVKYWKEL